MSSFVLTRRWTYPCMGLLALCTIGCQGTSKSAPDSFPEPAETPDSSRLTVNSEEEAAFLASLPTPGQRKNLQGNVLDALQEYARLTGQIPENLGPLLEQDLLIHDYLDQSGVPYVYASSPALGDIALSATGDAELVLALKTRMGGELPISRINRETQVRERVATLLAQPGFQAQPAHAMRQSFRDAPPSNESASALNFLQTSDEFNERRLYLMRQMVNSLVLDYAADHKELPSNWQDLLDYFRLQPRAYALVSAEDSFADHELAMTVEVDRQAKLLRICSKPTIPFWTTEIYRFDFTTDARSVELIALYDGGVPGPPPSFQPLLRARLVTDPVD